SRKKTRERNDSPGSPLNKNEVLKPQAFEKLVGIKTSTKFRAPEKKVFVIQNVFSLCGRRACNLAIKMEKLPELILMQEFREYCFVN
ncbi:hypothetical protein, partial [Allobaculum mucilyticum]|uniref:hypothetical protein n=1 Tax=Allobaculum mucilyticum TaxID=2834459 RepID=UPI001E56B13B